MTAVALNVTVTEPQSAGFITVFPDGSKAPNSSNLNYGPAQTVANMVVVRVGKSGYVNFKNTSTGWVHLVADQAGYFYGPAGHEASMPGMFTGVNPARLLDTRLSRGPLAGGAAILVQIAGRGNVPPTGVSAVVVNVTVTQPTSFGFITAYPADWGTPEASNVNYRAQQTVPNLATVRLSAGGALAIENTSSGTAHVIVDVMGYYWAGEGDLSDIGPGGFVPLAAPTRQVDSRIGLGLRSRLGPNRQASVQVTGRGNLPTDNVMAIVHNLTVTEPTSFGFVTAYPSVGTPVNTSNVNYDRGETIPNMAITLLSADGKMGLANTSSGAVQVISDVAGAYVGWPSGGVG